MKLTNPNALTQLKWEIESLIGVINQEIGKTPNTEINRGQNDRTFKSLLFGIRKKLDQIEKDHKGILYTLRPDEL
jgi:hypothetical protein